MPAVTELSVRSVTLVRLAFVHAENFAVLRHIALNLPRRETSAKRSLKGKRMKAALDDKYLLKVLTG